LGSEVRGDKSKRGERQPARLARKRLGRTGHHNGQCLAFARRVERLSGWFTAAAAYMPNADAMIAALDERSSHLYTNWVPFGGCVETAIVGVSRVQHR